MQTSRAIVPPTPHNLKSKELQKTSALKKELPTPFKTTFTLNSEKLYEQYCRILVKVAPFSLGAEQALLRLNRGIGSNFIRETITPWGAELRFNTRRAEQKLLGGGCGASKVSIAPEPGSVDASESINYLKIIKTNLLTFTEEFETLSESKQKKECKKQLKTIEKIHEQLRYSCLGLSPLSIQEELEIRSCHEVIHSFLEKPPIPHLQAADTFEQLKQELIDLRENITSFLFDEETHHISKLQESLENSRRFKRERINRLNHTDRNRDAQLFPREAVSLATDTLEKAVQRIKNFYENIWFIKPATHFLNTVYQSLITLENAIQSSAIQIKQINVRIEKLQDHATLSSELMTQLQKLKQAKEAIEPELEKAKYYLKSLQDIWDEHITSKFPNLKFTRLMGLLFQSDNNGEIKFTDLSHYFAQEPIDKLRSLKASVMAILTKLELRFEDIENAKATPLLEASKISDRLILKTQQNLNPLQLKPSCELILPNSYLIMGVSQPCRKACHTALSKLPLDLHIETEITPTKLLFLSASILKLIDDLRIATFTYSSEPNSLSRTTDISHFSLQKFITLCLETFEEKPLNLATISLQQFKPFINPSTIHETAVKFRQALKAVITKQSSASPIMGKTWADLSDDELNTETILYKALVFTLKNKDSIDALISELKEDLTLSHTLQNHKLLIENPSINNLSTNLLLNPTIRHYLTLAIANQGCRINLVEQKAILLFKLAQLNTVCFLEKFFSPGTLFAYDRSTTSPPLTATPFHLNKSTPLVEKFKQFHQYLKGHALGIRKLIAPTALLIEFKQSFYQLLREINTYSLSKLNDISTESESLKKTVIQLKKLESKLEKYRQYKQELHQLVESKSTLQALKENITSPINVSDAFELLKQFMSVHNYACPETDEATKQKLNLQVLIKEMPSALSKWLIENPDSANQTLHFDSFMLAISQNLPQTAMTISDYFSETRSFLVSNFITHLENLALSTEAILLEESKLSSKQILIEHQVSAIKSKQTFALAIEKTHLNAGSLTVVRTLENWEQEVIQLESCYDRNNLAQINELLLELEDQFLTFTGLSEVSSIPVYMFDSKIEWLILKYQAALNKKIQLQHGQLAKQGLPRGLSFSEFKNDLDRLESVLQLIANKRPDSESMPTLSLDNKRAVMRGFYKNAYDAVEKEFIKANKTIASSILDKYRKTKLAVPHDINFSDLASINREGISLLLSVSSRMSHQSEVGLVEGIIAQLVNDICKIMSRAILIYLENPVNRGKSIRFNLFTPEQEISLPKEIHFLLKKLLKKRFSEREMTLSISFNTDKTTPSFDSFEISFSPEQLTSDPFKNDSLKQKEKAALTVLAESRNYTGYSLGKTDIEGTDKDREAVRSGMGAERGVHIDKQSVSSILHRHQVSESVYQYRSIEGAKRAYDKLYDDFFKGDDAPIDILKAIGAETENEIARVFRTMSSSLTAQHRFVLSTSSANSKNLEKFSQYKAFMEDFMKTIIEAKSKDTVSAQKKFIKDKLLDLLSIVLDDLSASTLYDSTSMTYKASAGGDKPRGLIFALSLYTNLLSDLGAHEEVSALKSVIDKSMYRSPAFATSTVETIRTELGKTLANCRWFKVLAIADGGSDKRNLILDKFIECLFSFHENLSRFAPTSETNQATDRYFEHYLQIQLEELSTYLKLVNQWEIIQIDSRLESEIKQLKSNPSSSSAHSFLARCLHIIDHLSYINNIIIAISSTYQYSYERPPLYTFLKNLLKNKMLSYSQVKSISEEFVSIINSRPSLEYYSAEDFHFKSKQLISLLAREIAASSEESQSSIELALLKSLIIAFLEMFHYKQLPYRDIDGDFRITGDGIGEETHKEALKHAILSFKQVSEEETDAYFQKLFRMILLAYNTDYSLLKKNQVQLGTSLNQPDAQTGKSIYETYTNYLMTHHRFYLNKYRRL